MRYLILFIISISGTLAHADLTTAQKVLYASESIQNILGSDYSIIPDSINLKYTAMEKYNVFASGFNWASGLQDYQYDVAFAVRSTNGQLFLGQTIMETNKMSNPFYINNSTVEMAELESKQQFKCTLAATEFSGTQDSYRNLKISDLHLTVLN